MVYVDDLAIEVTINHKLAKWCRLTADTESELKRIAQDMKLHLRDFCPCHGPPFTIAETEIQIERDTYLITKSAAAHAVNVCGVKPISKDERPWQF